MPEALQLTKDITFTPATVLDNDPRGVVWMYRPPKPSKTYIMGVDPTNGITGWNRHLRTQDDLRINNAAIEVIERGTGSEPDHQACEYAAPIDPYELAQVANAIGRLYGGSHEDGQAEAIIEVFPGPGLPTLREMINSYGYTHHYVWTYLDSAAPRRTNLLGWTSSDKSVRDLYIRGIRHVTLDRVRVYSSHLVREMEDCEPDQIKARFQSQQSPYGSHGDRLRAFFMAIWAAHKWELESTETVRTADQPPQPSNWQASDVSYDQMMDQWRDLFSSWLEETE